MLKKFLIQAECDERTRMLCTDEEAARKIEILLNGFFHTWTTGPKPAIKVRPANLACANVEIP